jgi:hypothetical protein
MDIFTDKKKLQYDLINILFNIRYNLIKFNLRISYNFDNIMNTKSYLYLQNILRGNLDSISLPI